MSAATPLDHIADVLVESGYRRLPTPLEIGGLKFEFRSAFVGEPPAPDLIVVADTAFDDERRIQRSVEGLARALDVMGSKRPLTAVVAGPRPSSSVIDAMSRVCRVLPVGSLFPDDDATIALKNWLAVLMPLELPEPTAGIADPMSEVAGHVGDLDRDVGELVDLAERGEAAVRRRLRQLITERLGNEAEESEL